MVSSVRPVVACILLIFGSAVYAHSQTGVTAKGPTASISGKVTIKGKAAAGIAVGLRVLNSSTQTSRYKAVTDDQGHYKITNVPPGHYLVMAVAPVFVPSEEPFLRKNIIITKDEAVENVDISLVRGGVITGKVTDSEGQPVIDEQVEVFPTEMSPGQYTPFTGRTDDRGIYRIFGVAPGKYRVAAGRAVAASFGGIYGRTSYKQTFYPDAADVSQASILEVTEGSEATDVDIMLGRTVVRYSARGRIVDGETGRPLANVRYGLEFIISETSRGTTTMGAASNSDGEFKFEDLAPGKYAAFIEALPESEWRADSVPFEVIDKDVTGLVVTTARGGSVSGVLVLEGTEDKAVHASLRKVRIQASVDKSPHRTWNQPYPISEDGRFRIAALGAGTLAFSLANDDRLRIVRLERDGVAYPRGIPIKEGEQVTGVRVIVNHASGTVRGVVKVEGGTLPENRVILVSMKRLGIDPESSALWMERSTQVDARGLFFVEGLLPGTYEMNANIFLLGSRGRPLTGSKQQVVVTDGGATDVTLTLNLSATSDRP